MSFLDISSDSPYLMGYMEGCLILMYSLPHWLGFLTSDLIFSYHFAYRKLIATHLTKLEQDQV
jgi:hypothetical protein